MAPVQMGEERNRAKRWIQAPDRHARTALGCATLPNGNAVTLEAIARVSA